MKRIQSVNKNYYEFTGIIKHQTDRAILFYDGVKEVWIPKSQIEEEDDYEIGEEATITIPEWLAIDKELI